MLFRLYLLQIHKNLNYQAEKIYMKIIFIKLIGTLTPTNIKSLTITEKNSFPLRTPSC